MMIGLCSRWPNSQLLEKQELASKQVNLTFDPLCLSWKLKLTNLWGVVQTCLLPCLDARSYMRENTLAAQHNQFAFSFASLDEVGNQWYIAQTIIDLLAPFLDQCHYPQLPFWGAIDFQTWNKAFKFLSLGQFGS